MKAVILEKTCTCDELKVSDVPKPVVTSGRVLVKIIAFGINRSEIILRQYEADEDYINLPVIPGIECYGRIVDKSDSDFENGDYVIALMGGMGRSFDGSYAEYALLPEHHVFKIDDNVRDYYDDVQLGAIPETYFTAYGSLFECLNIEKDDVLLIRGGSSALGIASIQLAKAVGCTVIATTRSDKKGEKLSLYGADYIIIDDGNVSENVLEIYPNGVSKVLELVGPITMNDSMKCLKKRGILCLTGILGGEEYFKNFDAIKDIPNGKYLTSFVSNFPNKEDIDDIFRILLENEIKPIISKVYSIEEISQAHSLMENNKSFGKIVIKL